jgi:tetratricopeptide (TPR) repeat protein
MRRTLVILCFLAGLALSPISTHAQGIDPAQEAFVNAFLAIRKAEEQAASGDSKTALKTFRTAVDTLAKIKQQWPSWQPELLEYRLKRTQETINQLQAKMGPATAEAPAPAGDPGVLPPLDPNLTLTPPEPNEAPRGREVKSRPPKIQNTGSGDPLEEVKNRISNLETELHSANERLAAEQEKNKQMSKELVEAVEVRKKAEAERKKATDLADIYQKSFLELKEKGEADSVRLKELEIQIATMKAKSSGTEANLAAAEERINQLLERSRTVAQRAADASALPGKIKQLESKLAEEQAAKKDLSDRLAGMTQERDAAKMEITRLKDANKEVDKLMTENAGLIKKLGDAEKLILTFRTESPQKDAEIAALKKEVTDSRKALEATQEKNTNLQTEVGDLRKKVDEYTKQIQQFKTDKTTSAEERRKMEEENKLLQGIVMRVLQEDANRSQRKKMVQKELDRLQIQSDVLLKQISFLTEPVVKLSSAERRLFKRPIIDVQDPNTIVAIKTDAASEPAATSADGGAAPAAAPGAAAANSLPAPEPVSEGLPAKPREIAKLESKPTGDLPVKSSDTPAEDGKSPAPSAKAGANAAGLSGLPEEVRPLAEQAKQAFEREKYVDAEKFYEKALQVAPSNLYLWSNKGVTQFRAGKFKNAEESFRKAIAIAPEDYFSWCTLGIVEYSQGKYDEAVNSLTKSLAINNKNPTAHNYLGITAAQKGWIEAAQKELETAIQLDAKYADAWFNLAVTNTLKNPPNREEAKRAYQKALELGADVDPAMENLVK